MQQFFNNKSILNEPISWQIAILNGIEVVVKREDLLHPEVSGNKFRKLKYNLLEAKAEGYTTLLTFGGAYSNHIAATASAGYMFGFKTIGVIRGDELALNLRQTLEQNPTLQLAHRYGMQFKFVNRTDYRFKHTKEFITELHNEFGSFYEIPEGGTNHLAIKGCSEILKPQDKACDYMCVAVGTGGTISGLIKTAKSHQKVLGFPALKGNFLNDEISKYCKLKTNWKLITDYHIGGFAKVSEELITFINNFKAETSVPLDAIYTGKMFFGIARLIAQGYFEKGTKILVIHTGGLQGNMGMNKVLKKKFNIEIK